MHQVRVNDVGDVVLEDLPRQWVDEAEPRLDDAWAPVTRRIHFEFEVVSQARRSALMQPESTRRFVIDQRGGNVALDLFVVDQHLGSLLDATLAGADLTASLYAVYSQLARGPRTPGQLSETLGVRPTTLSGYLATMAGWGHVSRSRNEHDGRSSVLALTEAGHAKVRECRPLMQRALKTVNAEIGSAEDVQAARALIARIDAAIQVAHGQLR